MDRARLIVKACAAAARTALRRRWLRWPTIVTVVSLLLLIVSVVALRVAIVLAPFNVDDYTARQISTCLFDRNGQPLRAYLSSDERWRVPVRISEVSPWVIRATVAVEDKRFYQHSGVDWIGAARAALANFAHHRIVSGASTISMQVANLSHPGSRTFGRKFRQVFRAMQLEHHLTKDRILELYLTNAPYGGNICGIEAASRRYFGKGAAELCAAEATLLAGVPQSPSRLRPDRQLANALRRRAHVVQCMQTCGYVKAAEADQILHHTPPVATHDALNEAPHFCDYVGAMYRGAARVTTTLDITVQRQAERILTERINQLRPASVTNGAAVVIDNTSGDVLAMVGSANYHTAADGQVNGATALRSPGSTLKPLIYGYAYRCGNLLPSSMLYDVPPNYHQYHPENFDRQFRGLVSADQSLALSLNIPAVQVLNETGLARTLSFLQTCGLDSLNESANTYGLSLAIGTCGVRLLDLTNAYAMFARGGQYQPCRLVRTPGSNPPPPQQLLTPAAAYFVTRALSDPHLRPPENVDPALLGLRGVAWKTGTSNGNRDAWTIAYDQHHTVGVWLGNFDGHPSNALVGAGAAAPVALKLIDRLRPILEQDATWPTPPIGALREIAICTQTGYPASDDCVTTHLAQAPSFVAAQRTAGALQSAPVCSIHKRVMVDLATSQVLCMRCLPGHDFTLRTYAFWPAHVTSWLQQHPGNSALPPAHLSSCTSGHGARQLQILSPQQNDTFLVSKGRSLAGQKLALQAAAPSGAKQLYWFLDGQLLKVASANQVSYLLPEQGTHQLRCVDETGHTDLLTFTVCSE